MLVVTHLNSKQELGIPCPFVCAMYLLVTVEASRRCWVLLELGWLLAA